MNSTPLAIPEVVLFEPRIFADARGFFFESFNQRVFESTIGKLVRVIVGEVLDVAVDIRRSSPTFGQWVGERLSAENKKQLWIPAGFAHGFLVLSEHAEFLYNTTDYWAPEHERCIVWNDDTLKIDWLLAGGNPILSDKDMRGATFDSAEVYD